ncbi:hypothetical protein P0Y35_03760 [Kiritimatiellaeota bacterium B1221]|nr:hypothetical protein [Kiritimatiellaeota bacterium B1221]
MSDPLDKMEQIEFDAANLWREEVITDRTVGSIRIMTPITVDGSTDESRKVEYHAQTQIMTQGGALPIEGQIEAETLEDAIKNFGPAAKQALQDMMDRMREMQREQASQIVTPGQAMGEGMGGAPGGAGGFSLT